jgi:hypothetical protein
MRYAPVTAPLLLNRSALVPPLPLPTSELDT